MISVAQIRKFTRQPFGYLPVRIQTGKEPVQLFFLQEDKNHPPAFSLHWIAITESEEEAQELLEFYLRKEDGGGEAGKVIPFKFEDAIASLSRLQLALPAGHSGMMRQMLREVKVELYIRGFNSKLWDGMKIGKKLYHQLAITDYPEHHIAIQSLVAKIRNHRD